MGTKYISRKKNRRGNWVKYRDDRLVTAQQSTGAAQIANLKYILKNGSTGEFVEALDSIINERVRVALGQLVNNLDKGTGLAKVLGIDASNDLGASSIANLASVLSAWLMRNTAFNVVSLAGQSLDNFQLGVGYCYLDTAGKPDGYYGVVFSVGSADARFQFYGGLADNRGRVYVRYKYDGIWSAWFQLH